jgi:cell division protease FtsH
MINKQNNEGQNLNEERRHRDLQQLRPSPFRYLVWLLLLFLLMFYFSRVFLSPDHIDISYTEFKAQVRSQNVEEITIRGDKITGEFLDDYTPYDTDTTEVAFTRFQTILPAFDDPNLIALLEENNVTVYAKSESSPWLTYFLLLSLPWILIIAYFIYLRRQMQQGSGMMGGGLFNVGKSKAKRYHREDSKIKYDDVAGVEAAKEDLREIVEFLKEPDKFKEIGAKIPKGVLLTGPPGTGKTLLAKATAGEAGVPFYSISGSEFIEMFVGVGASRVRDTFQNARNEAPAIIFIDEIDSIGRARGTGLGGGHDEREQTLNQILSEMDGFDPREGVIVMAATNRPDILDPALTRPGRFDRQITLDLPHKKAREQILKIHSRNVPVDPDVDFDKIAAQTVGFAGANLENLVNEAALLAGRKGKKKVSMEDFSEARDKILLGAAREDMITDEERKVVAYHEAGHALVAKLLPGADPVTKVTIIPRGRALGVTEQIPENDRYNYNKKYILHRIAIILGGRAAEQLVFDDITSGAANDLKQVTHIARKMVTQWGMSEKVGPVSFKVGEDHQFLGREMAQPKDFSENTARLIDEEIKRIVTDMEEKAQTLLKENRNKLDAIAHALLVHETITSDEIDRLIGQKSNKRPEVAVEEEK